MRTSAAPCVRTGIPEADSLQFLSGLFPNSPCLLNDGQSGSPRVPPVEVHRRLLDGGHLARLFRFPVQG